MLSETLMIAINLYSHYFIEEHFFGVYPGVFTPYIEEFFHVKIWCLAFVHDFNFIMFCPTILLEVCCNNCPVPEFSGIKGWSLKFPGVV